MSDITWPQTVPCLNARGSIRSLIVDVRGTHIVLLSPPGDTAVLDSNASMVLRVLLADAEDVANKNPKPPQDPEPAK